MMRIYIYSFMMLIAQVVSAASPDTLQLHKYCQDIAYIGDSILRGSNDSVRTGYNTKLKTELDSVMKLPQSYFYTFSAIKNLSVLSTDDEKFRIMTWMLPTQRGMKYNYFGYVQVYNEAKKTIKLYTLKEQQYDDNDKAEYLRLSDSTWYGALYYKVVEKKHDGKISYTLLGWKGNSVFTTKKVIDNIVVTPSKIEFGKPVFKGNGKPKSRIILEYNSSANVSLKYNDIERMIIYDHLSSSDPRPESRNMYSLYGPDMTYDGLKFKDGFWFIQKDVQVRNEYAPPSKDVELKHDLRMQRKE